MSVVVDDFLAALDLGNVNTQTPHTGMHNGGTKQRGINTNVEPKGAVVDLSFAGIRLQCKSESICDLLVDE